VHRNSLLLFERYAAPHFKEGSHVLEIGPDRNPSSYRRALNGMALQWETAELESALMPDQDGRYHPAVNETTYRMQDEYEIPAADQAFDVVLAGQVIEHVRRPWRWLPELARVTKPGGNVILLAPISWPYHPAPYDCWRIYPDGMRALCDEAGLEMLDCRFESLEPLPSKRSYPYVGYYDCVNPGGTKSHWKKRVKGLIGWLKGLIGWPVPTALDLVVVARKPADRGEALEAAGLSA
jgi:SAM-dependent methyltransferase